MKNKYLKKNFEREYKETTKLDNDTKWVIAIDIVIAIFNIYVAIKVKQFHYITVAVLFFVLGFYVYMYSKLLKMKNSIIDIQEEHIKVQNNIINELLTQKTYYIKDIYLKDIKIPKIFKYPRKEKLQSRYEYYNKNKVFEVPIILDESNTLLDGYTSYLIAKKYNMKTVQAKVKKTEE